MKFAIPSPARGVVTCALAAFAVAGCSTESTSVPTNPQNGIYIQVDRLGRPGVKAVFENFSDHESTNRNSPYDDPAIGPSIANFAGTTAGRSTSTVVPALQNVFAVDELQINASASGNAGYLGIETGGSAFGGRALGDDAMDAILGATFGSSFVNDGAMKPCLATDNVAASSASAPSSTFPYLAEPN